MPTYTYQCQACDHPMTVEHGMTEDPRVVCDACGGLTRRLPGQGMIMKQATETADSEPENEHQCHSGCVLHRRGRH